MTTRERILNLCDKFDQPELKQLLCYYDAFFTDPASCKYHHDYEGGLADHSLGVFVQLTQLTAGFNTPPEIVPALFRIAMCHDLCKVGTYQRVSKSEKVKNPDGSFATNDYGKPVWRDVIGYDKADFQSPVLGHADSSIRIATRGGVELDDLELMCIRWHMGAYGTTDSEERARMSQAIQYHPLVAIVQCADLLDSIHPMTATDLDNWFENKGAV